MISGSNVRNSTYQKLGSEYSYPNLKVEVEKPIIKELRLKKMKSKLKDRTKQNKSASKEPMTELGILEVRTETSVKGEKPLKQKIVAVEKNGKLISLAR